LPYSLILRKRRRAYCHRLIPGARTNTPSAGGFLTGAKRQALRQGRLCPIYATQLPFATGWRIRYVGVMGQGSDSAVGKSPAAIRKERLAQQLRANLQRRKQQVRARRGGAEDETTGLPASNGDNSKGN